MPRNLLILTLTAIIAGLGVPCASAQNNNGHRLSRALYMRITTGQMVAFEAARARQLEPSPAHREREHVSINESNVAQIGTCLNGGWANMQAIREWSQNAPPANAGMGEAVELRGTELV